MFIGMFRERIDRRGIVPFPARFREELLGGFSEDRMILTRAIPIDLGSGKIIQGLVLHPYKNWLDIENRVELSDELTVQQKNAIARDLILPACVCIPDSNGNILISDAIRKYAHIHEEVIFNGTLHNIKLWSLESWTGIEQTMSLYGNGTQSQINGFG